VRSRPQTMQCVNVEKNDIQKQRTLLRPAWLALTRFRDLMISVLRLMGRGRPWSLRKRPQALQRTAPFSSLLQSGVYVVPQLPQTG
jgi:hypothetical protein